MVIGISTAGRVAAVCVAVTCFMTFASGRVVAEDPLLRAATREFPEFRKIVAPEEYTSRLAGIAESLQEAKKETSGSWPTTGATVNQVFPETQAAIAGVQEGDVLVRFDEWPVWTPESFPRSNDQPQRCEYFSVGSRRRKSFTAQPGLLGVKCSEYWRPDLSYLRSKSSDPKWDADAYLAITTAAREPDLAETAWSYAIEKGYKPDAHAAASGIETRFAQNRSEDAWPFASLASQADAEGAAEVHPQLLFRAAAANYQLRELLRLTERHPQISPMSSAYVQLLMDLHMRRPAKERDLPPPHVLAKSLHRDDLRPRLLPQRQTTAIRGIAGLKQGEAFKVPIEPAFFEENAISSNEPARNVDISFRFTWQPAPGDDKGYRKQAVFQVVDGRIDPRVDLDHFGKKTAYLGWTIAEELCELYFTADSPNLTYTDRVIERGEKEHEVRFLRIGGQAEMFVDGRRVLYMPVEENGAEPWLFFRTIGSTLVIRDLKFDELIEKP